MPGPYIHMSAARHAAGVLDEGFRVIGSDRIDPEWSGPEAAELADLIRSHPNFAALGAIGPDLFFFLPDFRDKTVGGLHIPVSSVLVTVLGFLEDVYAALDPYISKYEKYLGPISEDTAEEISRLTGGLSESVGNITGELSSILITALADFATQQGDLLEFFSLGLNQGFDEQAYFWSDMPEQRVANRVATNRTDVRCQRPTTVWVVAALWSGKPITVRLDDLDKICAALDCTVADLLEAEPIAGQVEQSRPQAVGESGMRPGPARPTPRRGGGARRLLPPN